LTHPRGAARAWNRPLDGDFRNREDPDELWVLFDWSKEDFQRFEADPGSAEIMNQAGLQGPPEAVSVESAGTAGS
jgi:hypothetical protein